MWFYTAWETACFTSEIILFIS